MDADDNDDDDMAVAAPLARSRSPLPPALRSAVFHRDEVPLSHRPRVGAAAPRRWLARPHPRRLGCATAAADALRAPSLLRERGAATSHGRRGLQPRYRGPQRRCWYDDRRRAWTPSTFANLWRCAALHYGALSGSIAAVRALLELGATVDVLNWSNETPLHYAAANGAADIAKLLLQYGADPHAKSVRQTPQRLSLSLSLTGSLART